MRLSLLSSPLRPMTGSYGVGIVGSHGEVFVKTLGDLSEQRGVTEVIVVVAFVICFADQQVVQLFGCGQ